MNNLKKSSYDAFSDFNLDKHIETFGDSFLDLIIDEDGAVSYAVPSHYDYMVNEYHEKFGNNINQEYERIKNKQIHFSFNNCTDINNIDRSFLIVSCDEYMKRSHDIYLSLILRHEELWWLCRKCNCICVWSYDTIGSINDKQREILNEFKKLNIYKGDI